jgi:hypothetical protein
MRWICHMEVRSDVRFQIGILPPLSRGLVEAQAVGKAFICRVSTRATGFVSWGPKKAAKDRDGADHDYDRDPDPHKDTDLSAPWHFARAFDIEWLTHLVHRQFRRSSVKTHQSALSCGMGFTIEGRTMKGMKTCRRTGGGRRPCDVRYRA